MTIHVVTTEHGTHSFPDAGTWETTKDSCDIPEGGLLIGSEDIDLAVAEFAKGAWQFVYETKDNEPEPKPRVFASIWYVPPGVVVSDRDGSRFFKFDQWNGTLYHLVRDSRYSWLYMDLDEVDQYHAPFTEVLDV